MFVARVAQRSVVGAFERWREAVNEIVELREKMHRVMARLAMRAVSDKRPLRKLARRGEGGQLKPRQGGEGDGASSMRAVSGAMFRWKEFVEETKHMRGLLQRASMALTKRCMVSAFAIWKEKMDEAAEALAKRRSASSAG